MKTSIRRLSVSFCLFSVVMAFSSVMASRGFARTTARRVAFVKAPTTTTRRFAASTSLPLPSKNLVPLAMSRALLEEGDDVHVTVDGNLVRGTVKERRGAGWYAIQIPMEDGSSTTIKCRGSSIKVATEPEAKVNGTQSRVDYPETTALPLHPIVDLDALMKNQDRSHGVQERLFVEQCAHHASYTKWVMFSDLHVSPTSLDTCLEVLATVHTLAKERDAGVLFLGDWWHHRGTIRIDSLNAVLEALRSWDVPMILIPGNHDQVTLGLTRNHGLTPLEHAYRVETVNEEGVPQSFSGPLVLSHPTKFHNALFVPHIRDIPTMESVLRSTESSASAALFVHADITGAYMNDLIISQGGVAPSKFPANKPIYSGHFHKPHVVTSAGVAIEYIGSPYETSLSEAGQQKSLLVLDAEKGWNCVERIAVDIGRRHFRITSVEELLQVPIARNGEVMSNEEDTTRGARKGDRVVASIEKEILDEMRRNSDQNSQALAFEEHIKRLRDVGVKVEVREIKSVPVGPMEEGSRVGPALEEMTPQATITSFFASEVKRKSRQDSTAEPLLKAALECLEEMETTDEDLFATSLSNNDTELCLESVSLQGFGPFRDSVTYPLNNRGLVLIRGVNKDGGSDSNGSGKSSLAMAALWALTGSTDTRPLQDSKVSDVVNDNCKTARVSLRGTLNGEYFAITRTKAARKGGLSFHLGGEDLTTQSAKETQLIIDEKLGVTAPILARTIFHGQHAINGLLEASDAKLKDELSVVVPLSLWQEAASVARSKSRAASKEASSLEGMVALRTKDLEDMKSRLEEAKEVAMAKRTSYNQAKRRVQEEFGEIEGAGNVNGNSLPELQIFLNETNSQVKEIEGRLESLMDERDSKLPPLEAKLDELSLATSAAQDQLRSNQRELDGLELRLESAKEILASLALQWDLQLPSDGTVPVFVPPSICPTCQQPISSSGSGHSHEELKKLVLQELHDAVHAVSVAQAAMEEQTIARASKEMLLSTNEQEMQLVQSEVKAFTTSWESRLVQAEKELFDAREAQLHQSTQVSEAAQQIQETAEMRSLNASLAASLDGVQAAEALYDDLCNDVEQIEATIKALSESSEEKVILSGVMSDLADVFGPRGVQTFILQNAINALQTTTQAYLDELSDGAQKLELELDSGDRISRTAFVGGSDGSFSERPLSSLSGGQWRRCSLAMSLGFADLLARRGRLRPSLCVLDEPLTHLDRTGRAQVGKLLRSLLRRSDDNIGALDSSGMQASTILLILQDLAADELEESFDIIDEVVKEDGRSTVATDGQS